MDENRLPFRGFAIVPLLRGSRAKVVRLDILN